MRHRMGRVLAVGAVIVVGCAIGLVCPRAAASVPPIEVDLGTHVFG